MTLIQSYRCLCKERISKNPLKSSLPPESSHNKSSVDLFAIDYSKSLAPKYKKKDLQKIYRTVLKAQVPSFDKLFEKPLKAKSPDVYCSKFHIECYNFCQQCEDYFATAGAKGSNHIFFATFFLCNHINFR